MLFDGLSCRLNSLPYKTDWTGRNVFNHLLSPQVNPRHSIWNLSVLKITPSTSTISWTSPTPWKMIWKMSRTWALTSWRKCRRLLQILELVRKTPTLQSTDVTAKHQHTHTHNIYIHTRTHQNKETKMFSPLGFGSFVEKTVMPYISTTPARLINPCTGNQNCTSPFSYKNVLTLTGNGNEFNRLVSQQQISGNLDSPEGGFDAIMQVAVCEVRLFFFFLFVSVELPLTNS